MTVCFFIATLDNSAGTERATTTIANELSNRGYDVIIISWSGGTTSFFQVNDAVKCYSLYSIRGINIYSKYLPSLVKYKRLLKKIKPDVVIDVCVPLSLLTIPATAFSKIKNISWEHFNANVSWNIYTGKLSRWLVSKFSTKVVVLTQADFEIYAERYNAGNIHIIANPVSIIVRHPSTLRTKNILAIGRLTHQKGFDLLLQAWHKAIKEEENLDEIIQWKLRIVGGGEDEQKLKQLSLDLNLNSSVQFIPPTKHIEQQFLEASLFVMSSRFEGLPLALVEAKAFGLPTISYDCETGPREVITHEVDGLLVEPENVTALAEAIKVLIKDPLKRRAYAANSLGKAKKYRLEEIIKRWDDLLLGISLA